MGLITHDDGWRISDIFWERMEPLVPPPKPHPLGCHTSRVPDRQAMNAILFVLRTGCQWNALTATGLCSSSSAHRRVIEWPDAGVFRAFWREGVWVSDGLKGLDGAWLSMAGARAKAPVAGSKKRGRTRPTEASKE